MSLRPPDDARGEEVPWRDLRLGLAWEATLGHDPRVPHGLRVTHAALTELDGYAAHNARELAIIGGRTLETRDQLAFVHAALNGMAPKVAVTETDVHKIYEQVLLLTADVSLIKAAAEAQGKNLDIIAKSLGVTNTIPPIPFRQRLDSLSEVIEEQEQDVHSIRARQTRTDVHVRKGNKLRRELTVKVGLVAIAIGSLTSAIYQAARVIKEAPSVETTDHGP